MFLTIYSFTGKGGGGVVVVVWRTLLCRKSRRCKLFVNVDPPESGSTSPPAATTVRGIYVGKCWPPRAVLLGKVGEGGLSARRNILDDLWTKLLWLLIRLQPLNATGPMSGGDGGATSVIVVVGRVLILWSPPPPPHRIRSRGTQQYLYWHHR